MPAPRRLQPVHPAGQSLQPTRPTDRRICGAYVIVLLPFFLAAVGRAALLGGCSHLGDVLLRVAVCGSFITIDFAAFPGGRVCRRAAIRQCLTGSGGPSICVGSSLGRLPRVTPLGPHATRPGRLSRGFIAHRQSVRTATD